LVDRNRSTSRHCRWEARPRRCHQPGGSS
jgi:hypothetical protein